MPNFDPRTAGAYGVRPDESKRDMLVRALYARTAGAQNPQTQETSRYLAGLPMNVEGLLDNYAAKFGPDAAKQVLEQLPRMNLQQLRELQESVAGASREADAQNVRETRGIGNGSYPR